MFIHNQKLNPCKCGSKKEPNLDSDDYVPCWSVFCPDCKQNIHDDNWTMTGAVNEWNKINKINK
jgi:hypothetical protein